MSYDNAKFNHLLDLPENVDTKFYQEHAECMACHFGCNENCTCERHEIESERLLSLCINDSFVLSITQELLFRTLQSYQLESLSDKVALKWVLALTDEQLQDVVSDVKAGCSKRDVISKLSEFSTSK
ncbi:hypothetical protein [Photobacterium damselae]|uniref:Uncharacterized protein n=1 Tax=Photobacterium damselae TaxID=38293 RepID=A0A2T3QCR4_PHODM|nr:hypothetical protein [Photobacterium damselae]KAB1511981.1 hypothetical protein FD717_010375 [Photobacterium damselae subsp. damselae]PSW82018.1 hypothetical protein CTN07_18155 [Photobacterium damselae]TLS67745.1 hypothetical protein FD718_14995 [Photobacterium damselae subsp. damselae]TLS76743.1 hypothetical protein FD721_13005 [Photobacterium damselae subsp. damselae]TLS84529.1 hypothetical protein FD720_17090 [Photobacterium damselae subsp. damselae]